MELESREVPSLLIPWPCQNNGQCLRAGLGVEWEDIATVASTFPLLPYTRHQVGGVERIVCYKDCSSWVEQHIKGIFDVQRFLEISSCCTPGITYTHIQFLQSKKYRVEVLGLLESRVMVMIRFKLRTLTEQSCGLWSRETLGKKGFSRPSVTCRF